MAISLFRAIGSLARNIVVANALGSMALFCVILMGGFVLVKADIHPWTCVMLLPVAASAGSICMTTHQCWPEFAATFCLLKNPCSSELGGSQQSSGQQVRVPQPGPSLFVKQETRLLRHLALSCSPCLPPEVSATLCCRVWVFWINPMQYAQRAILINEFSDPRWQNLLVPGTTQSVGNNQLATYGFVSHYW